MSRSQALLELLTSTIIWGFGFTATIYALRALDPVSLSVFRFLIAAIVSFIFIIASKKTRGFIRFKFFKSTFFAGLFLGLTLVLQTWGLLYTSATNSAFLTTLYVVLVPLIESVIKKKAPSVLHLFWVCIALIGTILLVEMHDLSFSIGDILTLACALTAALHILVIDHAAQGNLSPFLFNTGQSFWAGIIALLAYPFINKTMITFPTGLPLLGFLSLTFGSTMLAFALQIRAQKYLNPSVSSVIFLLESPFSMFFAFLLLNETFTRYRLLGALMIFIAAIGATYTEHQKRERLKRQ